MTQIRTDLALEAAENLQAGGPAAGELSGVVTRTERRQGVSVTEVLGRTGMETCELIRAAAGAVRPAAVVAVDALAARSPRRLCRTVQLSDTGLIPGSGVGSHRTAVDRETVGVPVIAVGVPTVIDGAALGSGTEAAPQGLYVTPRDIDRQVRQLGRLLGYGISLALQPGLTTEELAALAE